MSQRLKYYILNAEHEVVEVPDVLTWGRWFEQFDKRMIDYTEITSECYVSTVFIGIDHRHFGKGPPLVFETMIFNGPDALERDTWRYSSWDDAMIGHKAAVRMARKALGQKVT